MVNHLQTRSIAFLGALLSPLLLSLARFAYVRLISPQYGRTATTLYLNTIILASIAIALVLPFRSKSLYAAAGVALAASPKLAYHVASRTARFGNPVWGPVATHTVVIAPIAFLLGAAVVTSPTLNQYRLQSTAVFAFATVTVVSYIPDIWGTTPLLEKSSDSKILLILAGYLLTNYLPDIMGPITSHSNLKQSKLMRNKRSWTSMLLIKFAILLSWSLLSPFLHAPILTNQLKAPYLHSTYPLKIYSSMQSTTGTIVVGEGLIAPPELNVPDVMQEIRYLRADHSILGGVWTGRKAASLNGKPTLFDSKGTSLGDSIYSTFVLQEASRLMHTSLTNNGGNAKNALFIGLGTGIAASAFQRHEIATTIVEIDPAVFQAALDWFGLQHPGPGRVFLEDAGAWVAQRRQAVASGEVKELFDIVVHDCFSGGGVPEHIFTVEFWQELMTITDPEGVVAVNFAGVVSSDASRSILLTLEKVFPHCRVFHDSLQQMDDEALAIDFINLVFFCTPSAQPLIIRTPRSSDYLNSHLRQYILSTLTSREVSKSMIMGNITKEKQKDLILTKDTNVLDQLQASEALRHWSLMRQVLSDIFWETY